MAYSLIPTCTKGSLYLGSVASLKYLEELNIGLVISLYPINNYKIPKSIKHISYSISDIYYEYMKMNSIISETSEEISTALNDGINVLVHCFAGISRSSTVVLDYLLSNELSYIKSYKSLMTYIRQYRPQVQPNRGFAKLLIALYDLKDEQEVLV